MPPPPRVECGDVELRLISPRSAGQLFALARDPTVSRLLQWSAHEAIADSLAYIDDARTLWDRGVAWLPGIFDRDHQRLVGCIGLSGIDRVNRRAEVGTWIGAPYQRRGFNRMAKGAAFAFGFQVLGLRRLELLVRPDNAASLAAMGTLPGIRLEGTLAERLDFGGAAHDALLFAMLASDFDESQWPPVRIDRTDGHG